MALTATTVLQLQNGGSDLNGGGYESDAGTTDYSLQDAAQYANTDAVTDGTTTITSAGSGFTSQMVGNAIYVAGGTGGIAGVRRVIATFVNSTRITVNDATGLNAGTNVTINVGGALASYGNMGKVFEDEGVSGMIGFIKYHATPYDITSASDNIQNGVINFTSTSNSYTLVGYDTTRTVDNTDANMPTIRCVGVDPQSMLDMNNTTDNQTQYAANLIFDINGRDCLSEFMVQGSGSAYTETVVRRITAIGDLVADLSCFQNCRAVECRAINAGKWGYRSVDVVSCYSSASAVIGYLTCISADKSVADGDAIGFQDQSIGQASFTNCLAHNCSSHGFVGDATNGMLLVNCASVENGGKGYDAAGAKLVLINCASGDNTSGRGDPTLDLGAVILPGSGTYFDGAGSGDFRPAVTGDAALLNAAATYVQSSTLNATRDIGAVQHADPAGGGMLVHPGTAGGARG